MLDLKMRGRQMQYLAALSASFLATPTAMHIVWASPTLPILQSEDSPVGYVTDAQGSWLVSLLLLSAVPATPLVPFVISKIGEKLALIIGAIFIFAAWILYVLATNIWIIYLGRVVAGFAIGLISTAVAIYTGEIADSDIRGKLCATIGLMKLLGAFVTLIIGPYISYNALALLGAALSILAAVIFFLMPQSPHFLVKRSKPEEAKKVIRILSGTQVDDIYIDKKYAEIEATINYAEEKLSFKGFIKAKQHHKAFGIMLVVKTLQMLSGTAAIESYMQTIINKTNSSISAENSSIIFGAVQIPSALLSMMLVDKLGRKPMLIMSAIGCGTALLSEGIYFVIQDGVKGSTENIEWLPTTALTVYVISASFGIINLPYVLISELFSSEIKETAVTLLTTYGVLIAAGVTKFFEPITTNFGFYTGFWIFSACCLLGGVVIWFILPETKAKSFVEIQDKLKQRDRKTLSIHTLGSE